MIRRSRPIAVLALALLASACGGKAREQDRTYASASRRGEVAQGPAARSVHNRSARVGARLWAFVALEHADAVAILAGPNWRVVRRVGVAAGPHNLEVGPGGLTVGVTSPPADRVTLLGGDDGRVLSVASVAGYPHDLVFSRDGRAVWVSAERAGRLVELAVPGGRTLRSRAVGGHPHDLALSPDGRQLWVTIDGSPVVQIHSAATGRRLGGVDAGGAPHDLAFAPDGRTVWLSNFNSRWLTVVSTSRRQPVGRLDVGGEPHHFAFALGCLWASDNLGGRVVRIDWRRVTIRGAAAVGAAPHHLAATGSQLLIAVHGTGRVAVLSPQGRLVRSIKVGAGPHGIGVVPVAFGTGRGDGCP